MSAERLFKFGERLLHWKILDLLVLRIVSVLIDLRKSFQVFLVCNLSFFRWPKLERSKCVIYPVFADTFSYVKGMLFKGIRTLKPNRKIPIFFSRTNFLSYRRYRVEHGGMSMFLQNLWTFNFFKYNDDGALPTV